MSTRREIGLASYSFVLLTSSIGSGACSTSREGGDLGARGNPRTVHVQVHREVWQLGRKMPGGLVGGCQEANPVYSLSWLANALFQSSHSYASLVVRMA